MSMAAKSISAAGRRISYFEAGQGPALGLLHGIGSNGESFERLIELLSDRFRVIAWNAPGYGASAPLLGKTPSATDYANAAASLFDALATGPLHLLGHSLGAIVAGRFAVEFPDRVRKLVLANAASGYASAPPEVRAKRLQERIDHVDQLGPRKLAETRWSALLAPGASAAAVETVKAGLRKLDADAYKQAAQMLANADLLTDAARIAAPTLVVCGTADQVTPESSNRKIAGAIRRARYRSLPNLGHISYAEDPETFAGVLADFLLAPA
jgi:pimeloyl-ACP methyl ester carboxylesterase